MKYSIFLICIISLSAFSCHKEEPGPGEIVDIGIDFILKNQQGQDLLNNNTTNNLLNSEIKVYYLENGIEREVNNPDLDCPRNFCFVDQGNNNKIFRLFPVDKIVAKKSTIFIQWNSLQRDKIEANIVIKQNGGNSNSYCDSVWVNGILKFPNLEFVPERKFIHIVE